MPAISRFILFLLPALVVQDLFALDEGDLKDDKDQIVVHYAVEAPKNMAPAGTADPAKQLGLFVCFHEHNGKAPDETRPVIESLKRLNLSEGYVVLGMKDGTAHGYSPVEDHERAVKLIAWAKKTYPINPRRVYLWGRGEGAKFVDEFGPEHADIVANVITYSWGSRKKFDIKDPALNIPDYYVVLGLKDLPTHYKTVRDTYTHMKTQGYNVIYRETEGLGGPTKHQPTNDDAILWATRSRHKTLALSPQEQELVNAATPDEAGIARLVLVGGRQAGAAFQKLFVSDKDETRIAAFKACSEANLGPDVAAALAKEISDASPAVRETVIASLGVQANWRNLPAQEALIRLATDSKTPPEERAMAVDAIGAAVKLQIKGSYQDVPLFKALVTLLDDDEAPLRARAFAILASIMPSDYKPDASKADRAAAVAKWIDWADNSPKIEPQPPIPPPVKKDAK